MLLTKAPTAYPETISKIAFLMSLQSKKTEQDYGREIH